MRLKQIWNNLPIGQKIGFGFTSVFLLLALVVGVSYTGINDIVHKAGQTIEGSTLYGVLTQQILDQQNWLNSINLLLTDGTVQSQTLETELQASNFGQWFYSEDRQAAEKLVPDIIPLLSDIEEPYRHLYQASRELAEVFQPADIQLPAQLVELEVAQQRWISSIRETFIERLDVLNVELDPALSAVGKWLASEEAKEVYELGSPEFQAAWDSMLVAHAGMHATAGEISMNLAYSTFARARRIKLRVSDRWNALTEELFLTLNHVSQDVIDPARIIALSMMDLELLEKWNEIDLTLNKSIIRRFLESRLAISLLEQEKSEAVWQEYEKTFAAYLKALEGWGELVAGNPELEKTTEMLTRISNEWAELTSEYYKTILSENAASTKIETANTIFNEQTIPLLNDYLQHLGILKNEAEAALDGMKQANQIYATQIIPLNGDVMNRLQAMREEVGNSTVTNETMLAAAQLTRQNLMLVGSIAGILSVALGFALTRSIKTSLSRVVEFANKVARGDLSATFTEQDTLRKDEIGMVMNAIDMMTNRIREVLHEISTLIQAVQDGELDARGRAEDFAGAWKELVAGLNTVFDAFVAPINMTANYIERLSKSDIPEPITDVYNGDFNKIKDNLNRLSADITLVLSEMKRLSQAIQDGELGARGKTSEFGGGWHDLVAGVNDIVEAFVTPITVTATFLDRIARGDMPEPLDEEYKGDFNLIKKNLNMVIETTNKVVQLTEAIANGHVLLDVQERSEQDSLLRALKSLIVTTRKTASVAEDIANGNLDVQVQERSEDDRLMQAMNRMIHSLKDVASVSEEMAVGNLTLEVQERSDNDVLMRSLNTMLTKLNRTVHDVKTTAEYVATRSLEMSATADALSQGNSQQAAAAEEASASMEQMAANIRQNSDNARITETIALESFEDAQKGGTAVAETIKAMKGIENRISIIQEIAMQTSILSMNATIEAAKAQDYGKGFAVVASEVRSLAQRSREAAEEIEHLVRSCVEISEQAGEILQRLVPNSQKTAELVQEISAASGEQSMGADQVNRAIQQLDMVIQQNAATAEEMAASSEQFTTQASQLRSAMEFFSVREVVDEIPTDDSTSALDTLLPLFQHADADDLSVLSELVKAVMAKKHGGDGPESKSVPDVNAFPDVEEQEDEADEGVSARDERDDEFEHF